MDVFSLIASGVREDYWKKDWVGVLETRILSPPGMTAGFRELVDNKGYHEGIVQTTSALVALIYSYYREVQVLGETCSLSVGHHERKWRPPAEPYVKVNFDATYRVHSWQSCSGVVVTNRNGLILGASKQLHHYVPNAFVAEVKAFIQTVSFADDLGLRYVVFEGNTLIVIKNICSTHEDRSEIAALIKEGFNLGMYHFCVEEILVEVEVVVAANI
uniref:RNase H type-1 domain-containing protein n=1 Tax=Gossypium raimondii TaxID=29730 RepID=A0A0D2VVI3_GOSRA|nr:hypothetical protein B456_012G046600 [Gossypium raimondii]